MEVGQLQFLILGIIFIINTAVGLAPVLLKGNLPKQLVPKANTRNRLLSAASCFSAGVFLFVCFMGLLPEADKKFHHFLEELGQTNKEWEEFSEFPWAFFVVTFGFLIIFTIDKMVHAMEHTRSERENAAKMSGHKLLTQISINTVTPDKSLMADGCSHFHDDCHGSDDGHGVPSSVIFLIALGIHSVFEGMAVGLQTQKEKVMELGVAVLVHEVVMAFTFGMEVSKSKTLSRWYKIVYILLFTSTIPVGVTVGMGLHNSPTEHRDIVSAVFEAFATGIFIHVIFIEVLAQEFPGHHHHHSHHHDDDLDDGLRSHKKSAHRPETFVIFEKVFFICLGLLTLIILSFFMHSHH